MKPRDHLLQDFWTGMIEVLGKSAGEAFPRPTDRQMRENWISFPFPVTGASLRAGVGTKREEIWVYLILTGPRRRQNFRTLQAQKEELERLLGGTLEWDVADHTASSHIRMRHGGVHLADRATWAEQHAWFAKALQAFSTIVPPRLQPAPAESPRLSAERSGSVTLSLAVSPDLKKRLEQEAARRGQATSEYARALLEERLGAA